MSDSKNNRPVAAPPAPPPPPNVAAEQTPQADSAAETAVALAPEVPGPPPPPQQPPKLFNQPFFRPNTNQETPPKPAPPPKRPTVLPAIKPPRMPRIGSGVIYWDFNHVSGGDPVPAQVHAHGPDGTLNLNVFGRGYMTYVTGVGYQPKRSNGMWCFPDDLDKLDK